ncbi:BMC domain-containing protein [candidate division GN15 bacterium]|nr:BMC domain-containing protein [candidate division GN15 bacterium]
MQRTTLGLIETRGLVGAIEAADAASKAAEVTISSIQSNDDAQVTVRIEGELGAVQAAVEAGAKAAQNLGQLITARVFGRPSEELIALLDHAIPARTAAARPKPAPKKKTRPAAPARPGQPKPAEVAPPPHVEPPAPVETVEPVAPTETTPPPPPVESEPPDIGTSGPSIAELEKLPVVKLRRFARSIENLPIQGREISMANKQQLLEAIKSVMPSG